MLETRNYAGKSTNNRKEPAWDVFFEAKLNNSANFVELRNEIIEHFLFLLDNIAEYMSRKFPASVSFEDCKQAGYMGLHNAVIAFDTEKNSSFVNYASIRIRGSILDYIRSIDPLSRQLRSMQSRFFKAKVELENKLGRQPTDEELIAKLNVSQDEFVEYSKRSPNFTTVSLNDDCTADDAKNANRLDFIKDNRCVNPVLNAEDNEIFGKLLKSYSLKERIVMTLYYKELLNLKEIGDILTLSESRVSQIRTRVLKNLYSKLGEPNKKIAS